MKTLKKTLCLVLAVVLALGVMVLPAYADKKTYDNFEDKDEVGLKYAEAVGTLTGMGIINGRDSKVEPQASITRAEAVTLVVRALLGKAEAGLLSGKATKFADVGANHYAAKYVNYAVEKGIVAGKSETSFVPNDMVTGYELARMLLVAAEIKTDFTSDAWQNQTGTTAYQEDLLVGLEHIKDLNKALTREEAAQMIWNTVRYVPDTVILDVVQVTSPTTGTVQYQVSYPVESIGGRVYNLTAMYNTDNTYDGGTWDDAYGRPSVQWSNGKTGEIYYQGVCGGITSFYVDHETLTVQDVKAALNRTDGINAWVYLNGWQDPAPVTVTAATDAKTKLNASSANDRGALVTIFPAPWGNTTYWVYVTYTYAAYNHVKTADGVNATANPTNTANYLSGTVTLGTGMGDRSIAAFGLTRYHGWSAVDVRVASGTTVQITHRSNNSDYPYFRLNRGDKVYASARAIIVDLAGNVSKLTYENVQVSSKYYNVWYDKAGNVLALVEVVKPADPAETVRYEDFGYVLEFSSKVAEPKDDMNWDEAKPAQVKVLMVNLKTGKVGIYDVGVTADNKYTLGVDNAHHTGIVDGTVEIVSTIEGKMTKQGDQDVLHGFVAYKQLPGGKYGITPVGNLNAIGSKDQGYTVATSFETKQNVPGRVDVTPTATHYADNATKIVILNNNPSLTTDKSRVSAYSTTSLEGYKNLANITTYTGPERRSDGVAVGINALFVYNTSTNMVETAYIFGAKGTNPSTVTYDYYVLMGRSDSVLGEGTQFTLMHDGVTATYPCDALVDVFLQKDDSEDALKRHPVVFVEFKDGKITKITEVTDEKYFLELPSVDAYLVGEYIADGNVAPEIGGATGDPIRLDPDCVVVSAKTGDVVTNTNLVGKKVKVYYADETMKTVSLIVVQDN